MPAVPDPVWQFGDSEDTLHDSGSGSGSGSGAGSGSGSGSGSGRLPAQIGPFQILGELGRGGMGVVYRAREPRLARDVALKVVVQSNATPLRIQRFEREGQVAAALDHPGIVKMLSAGVVSGLPYIAYELVTGGRRLDDVLANARMTRKVEWIRDTARAIGYAHTQGVVHRDVKPANVLIDEAGQVRVTDFGLAAGRGLDRLTQSGAMIGTPYYMSPEQIQGDRDAIGPPSDVWALGVILYEALTGKQPFQGTNLLALACSLERDEVVLPRRHDPSIPVALEGVCLSALRKAPQDRYASANALADALDAWLSSYPSTQAGDRRGHALTSSALWIAVPLLALTGLVVAATYEPAPPPNPAAELDQEPPQLVLASELPEETWEETIALRVSIEDASFPVDLRCRAERAQAIGPKTSSELRVPLEVGKNELLLHARDARGNRAQLAVVVVRRAAPDWYEPLTPSARPPFPLPPGVGFGNRRGEYVNAADGSVMVWVTAGTLMMGSNTETDEQPIHEVQITRGFFLGKYEVTWAQFRAFCDATARPEPRPGFEVEPDHPVHNVSWQDAQAYCDWARLVLPSEAQWALAARGPESRRFPWGDELSEADRCNILGAEDGYEYTSPVGTFPRGAAPCGALDMAGNVFEWVRDSGVGYQPGRQVDPAVYVPGCPTRTLRGGAFMFNLLSASATNRTFLESKNDTAGWQGFRVSRSGT